ANGAGNQPGANGAGNQPG
nr:Chain P, peptide from Circumsporozoite protein variant VK247 [Plasmodium vivax]7RM0_Q Chain Q, peptide from Circumsporozoite protein variant VK247 [Plasmodium vivax]7RM0_R Chain R, peptide from Circumsporozoite protein variant VK247 [Plasmodium vivax]7RM0_S Chain S, peptide from Circumsporozoite protein variant VK247 [Plasmodium vivax]